MTGPSAATRLVVLLGDPVSHSLSPTFQNAAIGEAGIDAIYVALRTPAEYVAATIRTIAYGGGAGNVTVPHKAAAAAAVDRPTRAVEVTGACNTFWLQDGEIHGDNTDAEGFRRAAESVTGRELGGLRILLLGAGGSASAVAWALSEAGAAHVVIANRTRSRAEALSERFSGGATRFSAGTVQEFVGESFDLVVNATSLGLRPDDPPPLPADSIDFAAAIDLVYKPDRTAWIRGLRDDGIPAEDGLEMLVQQGAAAFQRWFGEPPSMEAIRASLPERTD